MIARVPPKVLPDGIPLNFLPVDPLDFRSLFQDSALHERMTSLVIGGAGKQLQIAAQGVPVVRPQGVNEKVHVRHSLLFPDLPGEARLQRQGELGVCPRITALCDKDLWLCNTMYKNTKWRNFQCYISDL